MITADALRGLPLVLRRRAAAALLARQPATVREALMLPDIGRKTTRVLLAAGLLADPDQVQGRSIAPTKAQLRAMNPGLG